MLTKTKKWLVVFALAVVAVFLAACGGEKEPEKVAPIAIEISADVYVGSQGVLIGGEPMELSIITTPANAIDTVTWASANTNIATVDAQGRVTGLRGGRVKITATSTEDATVKHEIEVMVYEHMENIRVLMNAMAYIRAQVPEFVDADLTLPTYTNTLVMAEYFDVDGNKLVGNVFPYVYVKDTFETINVKLTYLTEKLDFSLTVKVVSDAEDNEFLTIELAKEKVAEFLADYVTNKVRENVVFPTKLSDMVEGEVDRDVNISWTSSLSTVLTSLGVYTRPNDDTPFTMEAYYVCGDVTAVTRHNLVANGFTKAEKLEYLTDNVLPKITEIEGQNMTLPVRDTRFNTTITWASSHPLVLSTIGKMDPFLETETDVTLTATIKYVSTISSAYDFEEDVDVVITVKPAANDAQKIILSLSNDYEEDFPHYFPYGLPGREGNTIPLPTTVGGDGEFKDVAVTWTSGEAGLFDAEWKLLKQYLRYHEVTMTFSVTTGGATATGEVVINVGVAEKPNTLYIGGRFASRSDAANPIQRFDEIHTFSTDDPASGTPLGTAMTYGHWTGFTFYRDVVHEDGSEWRYQYFANTPYTFYIKEGVAGGVNIAEDGTMTLFDPAVKVLSANGVNQHANYQGMIVINTTEKDIKLPIAFLNYKGSTITHDVNGVNSQLRQVSLTMDGWRVGMAADGDGKVVFGHGTVALEVQMTENAVKDEEGHFTLQDYVLIPAGGFAWDPQTSQNKAVLGGVFSVVDAELTVLNFTPKYGPMAPTA